jgi:hypothetical protein
MYCVYILNRFVGGQHVIYTLYIERVINIVTYRAIDGQRLGTHIPAQANSRNIRTYIARQQISKHNLNNR